MTYFRVLIKRGDLIESSHEAKCLVKNSNFKILLSTNNDKDLVYPRSSIKIFQALPLIISDAHNKFNLNLMNLAIACSSHCGELQHIRVLTDWINKIGLSFNSLKCGTHNPLNLESSNRLLLSGNMPTQLHNNCAGKHLAMLTGCLANKMQYKNYIKFNHPYQKLIRNSLEYFMNSKINKRCIGIDGCSAPQYAFSITSLANSMVNLAMTKNNNSIYSDPVKLLLKAIIKFPELIGGKNRFDTEVIKHTKGKIFCKGGAEGVFLFSDISKNIGGIIKVIDGNERAVPPIAMKIFKKLNLLNKNEKAKLINWSEKKLLNHAKIKVGKIFAKLIN